MQLSETQKKYLRGRGHALKPVILVGQAGASDPLLAEFDRALTDHELVKVKVRGAEREQRDEILASLSGATDAALVQRIGNVGLFYRPHPERPRIMLPDA
ncbi:MAG TPA: ribosome assembly RNA-binding protein YhbY [Steroidobacteraceae bacterium]|nr:ribosome assembly RNA-binding protein YhbY [Steroidobacteraceae bacterium]